MKKIFQEYGHLIIGAIAVSLIVVILSPLGSEIRSKVVNLTSDFGDTSGLITNNILSSYDTSESEEQSIGATYPVGSIYLSVNEQNPSALFGGTWQQLKDRFLLGAGDEYEAGETGGEAEHLLTIDEMPSHSHSYGNGWNGTGVAAESSFSQNATRYTASAGGDQPHNNMPPYLVVYMWVRVS